ncbi:recombinase family protein [Peterkaempfera griseoplana]|uniref:recombinase family protein n=1 Tax=Peterkaempfera griseoplana TaxID=66896 RepID=UPI0006E43CF4|nr:recombinase family protein [Peterkaempfera griseoplana]
MTHSSALSVWDDFEVPAHVRGRGVTLNIHDQLSAFVPQQPGAYLRISSDRFGLEAGVERQLEDSQDTRTRLGWDAFAKVYKENDTSAFKKKKIIRPDGSIDWVVVRPKFRQLLADLASGVIDGVVFYDLDRLVRQPRDLEDLIDVVEYVKRPVIGATGGRMNLINDSDRHMARMMCVMALKSSEDTARRVARMHLSLAQEGRIQGRIAYGWVRKGPAKGTTIPTEAAVVQNIFTSCLTGETAYSIATRLNREGIRPPEAKLWSSTMVNKMLRNPRYAGMVSYSGRHRLDPSTPWDGWSLVLFDDTGRPLRGNWQPIIDPSIWSQVQFDLQLRRQRRGIPAGTQRAPVTNRYLLSGILHCGRCGRGMVGNAHRQQTGTIYHSYRCPPNAFGGCGRTFIATAPAEQAITEGMEAFLTRMLTAATSPQSEESEEQRRSLQARLEKELTRKQDLLNRWTAGTLQDIGVGDEDYFTLLAGLTRKIARLREAVTATDRSPSRATPAQDLLNGWRTGTLRQRRAILKRYLHGIDVLPPAPANGADPTSRLRERLHPRWKTLDEIDT